LCRRREELHQERLDLGVAVEVAPDRIPAGLLPRRISDTQMVAIVPPSRPLAGGTGAIDIRLLVGESLIVSELSLGYGQIVSEMFENLALRPRIRAVVDNIETMKVAVRAGAGVALIPAGSADSELRLGELVAKPLLELSIVAYRSQKATSSRKEDVLREIVRRLRQDA